MADVDAVANTKEDGEMLAKDSAELAKALSNPQADTQCIDNYLGPYGNTTMDEMILESNLKQYQNVTQDNQMIDQALGQVIPQVVSLFNNTTNDYQLVDQFVSMFNNTSQDEMMAKQLIGQLEKEGMQQIGGLMKQMN